MALFPRSMMGRTVLALVVGLLAIQVVSFLLFFGEHGQVLQEVRGRFAADRVAGLYYQIDPMPAVERTAELRNLRAPGVRVRWSSRSLLPPDAPGDWRARTFSRELQQVLPDLPVDRIRVAFVSGNDFPSMMSREGMMGDRRPTDRWMGERWMADRWSGGQALMISLQLSDGSWLNVAAPAMPPVTAYWGPKFFVWLLVATLLVLLMTVWLVRQAIKPLGTFARAAERLGVDVNAPPMEETGPREVRRAAHAFNEMQRRLRSFIEDRTHMLAAISHDLRTPITRLKLRADFVDDDEQRTKTLADLDEMEAMIAATLTFARDDAAREARHSLDLASLLQSLCDDAADAGGDVTFDGVSHAVVTAAPTALKRAFGNLIGNAVKYAGGARVNLATDDHGVTVTIEDDGPGIPETELENVFKPFHRVERSRNRETGGSGLGLAVVRSAVRAHGGDVTLQNRPEGGLRATVRLPAGNA